MLVRCPSARILGTAVLSDHAIAFGGHSRRWGGAVATLRAAADEVHGIAYAVSHDELMALDTFEGVPMTYERTLLPIVVSGGGPIEAHVYRQADARATSAPSASYCELLRAAYFRHGFEASRLAAAIDAAPRPARTAATIFVYGSLLFGESNHEVLRPALWLGVEKTTASYTLFDLGSYPAMVESGHTAISGEVYAVGVATLRALDRLEGHPHLYRRVPVTLDSGRAAEAYVLVDGPPNHASVIVTGDWRSRDAQQPSD